MGDLVYSVGDFVKLKVNNDDVEPLDAEYDGQVVQINSIDTGSDYPYVSAEMSEDFCDTDVECKVDKAKIPEDTEPLLEWELI